MPNRRYHCVPAKRTNGELPRGAAYSPSPGFDDAESVSPRANANASPRYHGYPDKIYDLKRGFISNPATEWEKKYDKVRPQGLQQKQLIPLWDIGPRQAHHESIQPKNMVPFCDTGPKPPPAPLSIPDHFESAQYDYALGYESPCPEYPYGRLRTPPIWRPVLRIRKSLTDSGFESSHADSSSDLFDARTDVLSRMTTRGCSAVSEAGGLPEGSGGDPLLHAALGKEDKGHGKKSSRESENGEDWDVFEFERDKEESESAKSKDLGESWR